VLNFDLVEIAAVIEGRGDGGKNAVQLHSEWGERLRCPPRGKLPNLSKQ